MRYKTSYIINLISKPRPLLSAASSKPLTGLKRQSLSILLNIVHRFAVHGKAGSVTGHPYDTLYMPTYFHRNVRNTRSAIPAISVTISAIPVAISTTSAISTIFAIPKTSAIPALSTC